MRTICEPKMTLDRKAEYPWNVQLWYSYDGGITFAYSGIGKFFKNDDDAGAYFHEHRTPLRVFPLITSALQREYEEAAVQNGMSDDGTPDICGYYGRVCRQMNEEEGANRTLCFRCELQKFSHAAEMMAFARS